MFTAERIVTGAFFAVFACFLFAAMYVAAKGMWERFFFSAAGLVLTFLLGAAWVGFATDHMDVAVGAFGIFALAVAGLVFYFVMQARSEKSLRHPVKHRKPSMKIHVEVTQADLDEALADDLQDFEQMFRHQLDEGVSTNDGGNGTDWMPKYELEMKLV